MTTAYLIIILILVLIIFVFIVFLFWKKNKSLKNELDQEKKINDAKKENAKVKKTLHTNDDVDNFNNSIDVLSNNRKSN